MLTTPYNIEDWILSIGGFHLYDTYNQDIFVFVNVREMSKHENWFKKALIRYRRPNEYFENFHMDTNRLLPLLYANQQLGHAVLDIFYFEDNAEIRGGKFNLQWQHFICLVFGHQSCHNVGQYSIYDGSKWLFEYSDRSHRFSILFCLYRFVSQD